MRADSPPIVPASVDAVVCGGGPAGSTFATVLARRGWSVALFEREHFPRFHIGESLLPWNIPLFERIGVLEKIRAAGMQVKYGARFYHQGTDRIRAVRFANGIEPGHPSSFQVKRADFDKLLLDHSRQEGAAVFEGARVEDVLFDSGAERAVGVRVKLEGEDEGREIAARLVVDATGRDALFAKKLGGGRQRDPLLDRSAAFVHFDRFKRAEGPSGGDIVVITTPDGWWWLIPFSDGSVSVGIVMPSKRFKERAGSAEDLFHSSISSTAEVKDLLEGANRLTDVHTLADYSYKTEQIAGNGFVMIGDAAGFIDPVFSTGVLLAMTSGEMAAEVADRSLRTKQRVDASDFRGWEKLNHRAARTFTRFVHGFYSPHFLEIFYTPAPHPRMEGAVTTVLGGGVFRPRWRTKFWSFAFQASVEVNRLVQAIRGRGPFERATGIVVPEEP